MQTQSGNLIFRTLQIIHAALCLGPTLFCVVSYSIAKNIHYNIQPGDVPLIYVAPVMAVGLAFISNVLFTRNAGQIDVTTPIKSRLLQYQTACIIRYAPLEGAALFNVVVFILSGNLLALFIGAAAVFYMITLRPIKADIAEVLQVSYPDTLD